MKNKTVIKTKRYLSRRDKIKQILTVLFSTVSLGLGAIIAFYGKGNSFIENDLLSAVITLFGFGLTATVFTYQTFEKMHSREAAAVIKALSKTLFLTLFLVFVSLLLDFFIGIITIKVMCCCLNSLKYSALIYSMILQFDILNSFIVIITYSRNEGERD